MAFALMQGEFPDFEGFAAGQLEAVAHFRPAPATMDCLCSDSTLAHPLTAPAVRPWMNWR